ncbi:MAG: hypothetical protein WCG47_26910, partial [Dermatophilaceae bacterium]
MITTDAPAWLRRSDQAVTWARTMLTPRRAVVIDCETTDLPGGVTLLRMPWWAPAAGSFSTPQTCTSA